MDNNNYKKAESLKNDAKNFKKREYYVEARESF